MNTSLVTAKAPRYVYIITIGLIAVFVFLCVLLVREYRHVRRLETIDSYKVLINNFRHHKPLTAQDAGVVESWMTFRYINTLFEISPDYFKNSLVISDPKYPNISIGRYAKSHSIQTNVFVDSVRRAIIGYFNTGAK